MNTYEQFIKSGGEKKWQDKWEEQGLYKANNKSKKPKKYILDMFPYPSSAGLHVGHPEGYTATDIYCRYLRMNGYNVLHPMGWDAFGLPAENYAIKVNRNPKEVIKENIQTFKRQIKSLGFSYDWDREIATTDPEYIKWSQWFFLLMYKNGLAYKKKAPVNWCNNCKTVLANEQVVDGKCERCQHEVEEKELEQWFFKVTHYAEELLSALDKLDWSHALKTMQANWIGRSEGINFKHKVKDLDIEFEVYDSIPQTFLAQTFVIIAPEHPMIYELVKGTEKEKEVMDFVAKVKKKKLQGKFDVDKEKEGVFTGRYSENYMNTGRDLPIWVASFALVDYGTGIVGCSAHDERDFEFAKKYGLPLKPVLFPKDKKLAERVRKQEVFYIEPDGILEEPVEFKGIRWDQAREKIIEYIEQKGFGRKTVNYKIRDWLISRQRYWGAPIPIIYCEKCGEVPVPESDLPIELPDDVDFRPKGESPLKYSKEFHNVKCPKCGKSGKGVRRETDTMDGFVDNSWYYYRYLDPHNDKAFADKKLVKKWMPVDVYVGGAEHAVGHLIYSRFFTKVLRDQGYLNFDEPFLKLINQGMILGEDHQKMSKSRGNVINPDEVVDKFGADTLRMYEMFMGPLTDTKPWSTKGIVGIKRFIDRLYRYHKYFLEAQKFFKGIKAQSMPLIEKTIKKVTDDIKNFSLNTAISQLMIYHNNIIKTKESTYLLEERSSIPPKEEYEKFIILLSPFAPHLAEELWERLGHKVSIFKEKWPKYNPKLVVEDEVELVIQVNGKVRERFKVPANISEAEAKKQALASPKVQKYVQGEPKKTIFVPGKLINFVA